MNLVNVFLFEYPLFLFSSMLRSRLEHRLILSLVDKYRFDQSGLRSQRRFEILRPTFKHNRPHNFVIIVGVAYNFSTTICILKYRT